MKKVLTTLLALAMLSASLLPMTVGAAEGWSENADISGAALKIGVIGDSHVTTDTTWFSEALSAQEALSGGTLDGLALMGDIIYQNQSNELINDRYDDVMNVLSNSGYGLGDDQAPYVYAMGNHEFPQNGSLSEEMVASSKTLFTEKTGQALMVDKVIGGYHFIASAPENYNLTYSTETESWLKEEIDAAIAEDGGSSKPVFVMLHGPAGGTFFGKENKRFSQEFIDYLKTKPQVINLTAHEHVAAQLPQNIYQDGFTVFESPLAGGGYLEEIGCTSTGNITSVHQAAMITVDTANVVKIYKLDLVTKELIGDPWVVDIPAIVTSYNNSNTTAYLYSADKRTNTATPSFPEGAAVTAVVGDNGVKVTWPNTATNTETENQQDGFVRAYKLEIKTADGVELSSAIYQNDFYKETPSASFTKTIGGLPSNMNIVVKVYPMSPFGVFGDAISAQVTTAAEEIPENAIRYEFEDYVPTTSTAYSMIKDSAFASGGKLICSNQGGGFVTASTIARTANDPTFEFTINLPKEDSYKVEYAVGWLDSTYVSKITISIDGTVIGTNDKTSFDKDLSLNGKFPWSYIRLKHYTKSNVNLTAGEHTVKVQIDKTVTEKADGNDQPYLFCADYLQLTATTPAARKLDTAGKTRIELEDYADTFTIAQTSGTASTPNGMLSNGCSGGKYLWIDSTDGLAANNYETFEIPINVQQAGYYDMTYVEAKNISALDVYLDSVDGTCLSNGVTVTDGDASKNSDGKFAYFNSSWAQPQISNGKVYLPAGEHNLVFRLTQRSVKDFAAYIDYIEFEPVAFDLTDNKATAMVSFDKEVTGKAILALYNGNELVAISSNDVNSAKFATVTAENITATVTKAKVFVWNDFASCIPQSESKTVFDSSTTVEATE